MLPAPTYHVGSWPSRMFAVGPDSSVWIRGAGDTLYHYGRSGRRLAAVVLAQPEQAFMARNLVATLDSLGVVLIRDNSSGIDFVRVLDPTGAILRDFEVETNAMIVACGTDSLLYHVCSDEPQRVNAYRPGDGSLVHSWPLPADMGFVNQAPVPNGSDEIAVPYARADGAFGIRVFSTTGSQLRDFALPIAQGRYSIGSAGRTGGYLAWPTSTTGGARFLRLGPTGALIDSVLVGDGTGFVDWVGVDDYCNVLVAYGGNMLSYPEDFDLDGVCDTWEALGVSAGPGLANWIPPAANARHSNLYVQVSGMQGRCPNSSDLQAIATDFAAFHKDSLQFPNPDSLNGISLTFDLVRTNLQLTGWDSTYRQRLLDAKAAHFAKDWGTYQGRIRERIYRFCFCADTIPGQPTGEAVINGQNVLITLGEVMRRSQAEHVDKRRVFRGTLMHELGHSIGLRHGGADDVNYKPNYKSVMNYLWQLPHPKIKDYWQLDYSQKARETINYTKLSEPAGFGGNSNEKTIIGGGKWIGEGGKPYVRGDSWKKSSPRNPEETLSAVADGGAVDIDQSGTITSDSTERRVHWREYEGVHPLLPFLLTGSNDLKHIDLRIKRGLGATYGEEPFQERNRVELLAAASLWEDCDGDGLSNWEELEAGAADVDYDYVPDECEPERVSIAWPALSLCPAGDLDSLVVEVRAEGVGAFDPAGWAQSVCVVRDSSSDPGLRFWNESSTGWAPGDTAWATAYDPGTGRARIVVRRLSGCGQLALGVRVAGEDLGTLGPAGIGSLDRDPHSVGSVDGFDQAHWLAAWPYPPPSALRCHDLDGDEEMTMSDLSMLGGHMGHSIPRRLLSPDGGQGYAYGAFVDVRWARGWGDSARASLYLLRDSQPGAQRLLAHNEADDGQVTWPAYVDDGPATDYRIRVTHTAGAYSGSNSVGTDASDGPFSVDAAGGGCPTVDSWTPYGWVEENTVLGRSLTGALGLDAYRTRWLGGPDSLVRLRIRENEEETTTLDQVRLVAIDHRPEVRAYAAGERVLLGSLAAPGRVRTADGLDVTAETSGGGSGYLAAAGETLYVELGPVGAALPARPTRTDDEGDPFVIDDGGGKGGPAPQFAAAPAQVRSVDAQVLSTTGILVQCPDGEGAWRTEVHHYPREHASEALFDSVRSESVRLVFLDAHRVRFLGSLREVGDSLEATKLVLRSAEHSRLGDVLFAVASAGNVTTTLSRGDTLSLAFAQPPVPHDHVRDYFLLSRGVYTTNLPASQRPAALPGELRLHPGQPNPFRGRTVLRFDLPARERVHLEVFDVLGRRVRVLAEGEFAAGSWVAEWDAQGVPPGSVPPGVYLVRLSAGSVRRESKLVVLP